MMEFMKTRKLQKVVGKANYINSDTGENEEFDVLRIEESDFNFQKIWLIHLLEALNVLGNKKIKILMWLLKNKNYENKVIATQKKICEETGISNKTIIETIRQLQESEAIKKIQNGVYWLNPDLIWKGNHSSRARILVEYHKTSDSEQQGEAENANQN